MRKIIWKNPQVIPSRSQRQPECGKCATDVTADALAEILSQIPPKCLEKLIKREPEWQNMEPFLPPWGFGRFVVLMVALALNDYQLKGKAEVAYWPKIRQMLINCVPPSSSHQLYSRIEPFYQNERMNKAKIDRLSRFLGSPLALRLWDMSPVKVAAEFLDIWHELAITMHQKTEDKTITFAMKCLGLCLLMVRVYEFDFTPIPIPVDSRITKFTKHLGFQLDTAEDVRLLWKSALSLIRTRNKNITMIHLDSLLWQIASLNEGDLIKYFRDLEIPEVGDKLCALLMA